VRERPGILKFRRENPQAGKVGKGGRKIITGSCENVVENPRIR
jgi:hypothetical protein